MCSVSTCCSADITKGALPETSIHRIAASSYALRFAAGTASHSSKRLSGQLTRELKKGKAPFEAFTNALEYLRKQRKHAQHQSGLLRIRKNKARRLALAKSPLILVVNTPNPLTQTRLPTTSTGRISRLLVLSQYPANPLLYLRYSTYLKSLLPRSYRLTSIRRKLVAINVTINHFFHYVIDLHFIFLFLFENF